jgi:hypothetical protein
MRAACVRKREEKQTQCRSVVVVVVKVLVVLVVVESGVDRGWVGECEGCETRWGAEREEVCLMSVGYIYSLRMYVCAV